MALREKDELVGINKGLVQLVKDITESYDKEDRTERDYRRQLWMKLERYFAGNQRLYWDMVAKDWQSLDKNQTNRHYDKVINIYRAHAESIIAALSIKPPSAIFYPADAEIEEDITTAKACTKIKENIERINDAQLLLIKILMIMFNQGTVAAYVYNKRSPEYGTYNTQNYSTEMTRIHSVLLNCAECGSNIEEVQFRNEKGKVEEVEQTCAVCGHSGIPDKHEYEEEYPEITGVTVNAKARTQIEVFSPLFVYMPFYARKQAQFPYIRLRFEQHYAALKNIFPKLKKRGFSQSLDQNNADERGIFVGTNTSNLCTVDCWWVRDWGFDVIDGKDSEIKELKKLYPDGFYAVYVDDQLVEINNESMDDHWSVTENPLSTYIHAEPIGKGLAPIQDLENEILDLQIETFEHGIPETFARGDVLDFKKYGRSKAAPGMIYPVTPPAEGQSIADSFHTIKTASVSEETDLMTQRLDAKAQFVSAAFPSIYGGPSVSGSKTAREYTESRAMALQRLSLPWNVVKALWADIMSKAIPLYIQSVRETGEDEKIVEKTRTGFTNTWIRQADLEGKVGAVEADVDENLPMTPGALKNTIMELFTMKDDYIMNAMTHPNNTPLITRALGAPDFYIPGEDDRNKQYAEFADLLGGIPVEVKQYEDHELESEVCKAFLISPTGLMLKKQNPQGIELIEQHMMAHDAMKIPPPMPEEGKGKGPQVSKPSGEVPPLEELPEELPGPSNIAPFTPRMPNVQ